MAMYMYKYIAPGQGQTIPWGQNIFKNINFVELESPMLHAKFQDHRKFRFWRRFLKVFTIYGCGGHLDHVTKSVFTKCMFPLHIKFGFDQLSGFREKDV